MRTNDGNSQIATHSLRNIKEQVSCSSETLTTRYFFCWLATDDLDNDDLHAVPSTHRSLRLYLVYPFALFSIVLDRDVFMHERHSLLASLLVNSRNCFPGLSNAPDSQPKGPPSGNVDSLVLGCQ